MVERAKKQRKDFTRELDAMNRLRSPYIGISTLVKLVLRSLDVEAALMRFESRLTHNP